MNAVDRLLAEAEVTRLVIYYAALNDAGDFPALAATYVEDGVYVRPSGGEKVIGRAAILASFMARPPRLSRHVVGNIVVDVADAETATARSTILLYTAPAGPLPAVATGPGLLGGFEDRLVRESDGWRFAERRGWVDLTIPGKE